MKEGRKIPEEQSNSLIENKLAMAKHEKGKQKTTKKTIN